MALAVAEALRGAKKHHGGPFGAVVVRKGKVVAKAHNRVVVTNDPTAHAEVLAIRAAAKKLKNFDLRDCVLYASCEPCPMCLAAIHWARIKKVYFGSCSLDAKKIGFDDELFYEILNGKKKSPVKMVRVGAGKEYLVPLKFWAHDMKAKKY